LPTSSNNRLGNIFKQSACWLTSSNDRIANIQANYSEGQIVGYRWYDKHNVKPAFAFGHGLSYGTMT
jgi:beta-glucosidase